MTDRLPIETHRADPRRWRLLWLVLYPLAWFAFFSLSSLFWFLPAGLRLGTLWLLPRRCWWQMAVVEWVAILSLSLSRDVFESLPGLALSTVLPWCIYALTLRGVGRHGRGTPTREALPRLLVTGVLAATLTAMALTAIDLNDDGILANGLPAMLVSYALGDFGGVVFVVPIMLVISDQFGKERRPWLDIFANGLVVAPLLTILGLGALPQIEAPVYPLMLAMLPLFGIAYRFGWRPGALALGLLGVGVHFATDQITELWGPGQLQLLITAGGCAAILLGVASENQKVQRNALSATVQALSLRSTQLGEAANRMASLQEQERRRIGVELHDQLGQDMTAIATRLRVVERSSLDPVIRQGLASIGTLVGEAHVHLREVINQLHPAVLDRFGLARALAEGPFAEMLRDRGIGYICTVEGNVNNLPDNVASALYRICQEATTNYVRHGCGGSVRIHLAHAPSQHGGDLTLEIEDNAGRLDIDPLRPGRGLLNIRDRAHAIGAQYRFHTESGQPRHTLQLWVPHESETAG